MRKPPVTCSSGYLKAVNSWKPTREIHAELGYLTALVASMAGWVEFMINTSTNSTLPPLHQWPGEIYQSPKFESTSRRSCRSHEDGLQRSITALKKYDGS